MVISLVPKRIPGMDILSNWQNSHISFLSYERRCIIIEEPKWKPWKLSFLPLKHCKIKTTLLQGWGGWQQLLTFSKTNHTSLVVSITTLCFKVQSGL